MLGENPLISPPKASWRTFSGLWGGSSGPQGQLLPRDKASASSLNVDSLVRGKFFQGRRKPCASRNGVLIKDQKWHLILLSKVLQAFAPQKVKYCLADYFLCWSCHHCPWTGSIPNCPWTHPTPDHNSFILKFSVLNSFPWGMIFHPPPPTLLNYITAKYWGFPFLCVYQETQSQIWKLMSWSPWMHFTFPLTLLF